jgi:hypothetical protein
MKKLRALWHSLFGDADHRVRLGRILGLAFITTGFVVIGKAWDGAASINFATGQLPYLLSGGFMGLGLIITGATLLFLSTVRSERSLMSEQYEEMSRLLSRNLSRLQISANGAGGDNREQVVATSSHYHVADCTVLEGKSDLATVLVEQAVAEGLEPCRVCGPPIVEKSEKTEDEKSARTF